MTDSRAAAVRRLRRWAMRARTLAVVYLLVLFTATHIPGLPTAQFSFADKVYHLSGYAMLTLCVLIGWELTIGVLKPKHYFAVWLAGTLYAAFDELTQIPVGRTCDVNDWVADILGIVCGLVLFRMVRGTIYRLFIGGDGLALVNP